MPLGNLKPAKGATKNRKRLLDHEVADEFFAAVVRQAKLRKYVSEHPPPWRTRVMLRAVAP